MAFGNVFPNATWLFFRPARSRIAHYTWRWCSYYCYMSSPWRGGEAFSLVSHGVSFSLFLPKTLLEEIVTDAKADASIPFFLFCRRSVYHWSIWRETLSHSVTYSRNLPNFPFYSMTWLKPPRKEAFSRTMFYDSRNRMCAEPTKKEKIKKRRHWLHIKIYLQCSTVYSSAGVRPRENMTNRASRRRVFGGLKRRPARRRIREEALVRLTNHRGNPVIFPPSSTYPALGKIVEGKSSTATLEPPRGPDK